MNAIFLTVAVLSGVAGISAVLARFSFRYWVYGLLLCIPFDVGAPLGFIPRLSVVDYLSAAGLIALFTRFKLKDLLTKVFGAFGMPLVMSWGLFFIYSLVMTFVFHGSLKGVLRWGEFLFSYAVAVLAAEEEDLSAQIAGVLSAMGGLMAAWAMAQFWHFSGNYEQTFAIFGQHNGLGAFLSLCLPAAWAVFLSRKWISSQAVWGFTSLLISIAFMASYSRGAWLGLIGAVAIVSLLRRLGRKPPSWYVGLGLVLMLAGAAGPVSWVMYRESKGLPVIIENLIPGKDDPRFFKASQRMNYWKAAADIFRAHPWIGLGPKNYDRRIVDYLTLPARYVYAIDIWSKHRVDFWQHLHNIYLQMLVEYGAIGLILWALAFSILCLPLFQPSLGPFNMFQIAFQISGIAFLIHNGVDILFVNSFDLVVAIMLAQLAHASRTAAHLEAA